MNTFLKHIFSIICCLTISLSNAQPDKQKELEGKRIKIIQEIKKINSLLFKTSGQKKSLLTQVHDISQRISAQENLIKITNRQANLLTRNINSNLQKMEQLRDELKELKDDYASMINKSYKSKSQQSRVMFLFSSENFLQAYKRLQYMKQSATQRKKQGGGIKDKSLLRQKLNIDLIAQKKIKKSLIVENKHAKKELQREKKDQEILVASLRKDEGKFSSQIKKKEKQAAAIEKEIENLIKEAIAKSNREAEIKSSKKVSKAKTLALTPEAKLLAASFTSNKGKLIWPVQRGIVSQSFGSHRHPQFPNVTTNNNGVDITTEANANARAVFAGQVMQIQQIKGANQAIFIRHGNYITIYGNLATVLVKKGDKVSSKQNLGTIYKNPLNEKTVLKFYLYKNSQKMNPADWVYKM